MLLTKNNTIIIGQVATLLGLWDFQYRCMYYFVYIGYLCPAHSTHDQTAEVFKDVCDHES